MIFVLDSPEPASTLPCCFENIEATGQFVGWRSLSAARIPLNPLLLTNRASRLSELFPYCKNIIFLVCLYDPALKV